MSSMFSAVIVTETGTRVAWGEGMALKPRWWSSLSMMETERVAEARPGAEAVRVTLRPPLVAVSSMAVRVSGALVCPAGMVTVAGTVSWAGSEEARVTTRSAGRVPPRVRVASMAAPS